jgi:hypothetical protein
MAAEQGNAAVVRRFWDQVWNNGELPAIEELVDDDFTNFGIRQPGGHAALRHIVTAWRTAFPDLHIEVEEEIAAGDAVVHWVMARHPPGGVGGVRAIGLVTRPGSPPRVVGCATTDGELAADLVVDATGRRSAIDSWLQNARARRSWTVQAECGLAYYTRHYRLRPDAVLPGPETTRVVLSLNEFTTGIWGSDNRTMLLAIGPLIEDKRFRRVTDPGVFTAVANTVPVLARWLAVMDPISDIYPMGGLNNSMRRLAVDGVPVVIGLAAVGDSVCTTNPTFGRGLALALQGATDLAELLDEFGEDEMGLAQALDNFVIRHVEPFYLDQAANDGQRLAELRHTLFGAPAPETTLLEDRVTFAALRAAMPFDAIVFRAFWRVMGMLAKPDDVYTDPDVVARTQDVLRSLGAAPAMTQPTRAELEAALA